MSLAGYSPIVRDSASRALAEIRSLIHNRQLNTPALQDIDRRTFYEKWQDMRKDLPQNSAANKPTELNVPEIRQHDLAIVNIDSGHKSLFHFVPDQLDYTPESIFSPIYSMGRNNPFYHYTGSEDSLELELDWFKLSDQHLEPLACAKRMESYTKNNGYDAKPPRIKIIWGKTMFSEAEWLIVSAPYTMRHFNKMRDLLPMSVVQRIKLVRTTSENRGWENIRKLTT